MMFFLPHPLENGYFSLNNPISMQPASDFCTNRIHKAINIRITFKISKVNLKIIKIYAGIVKILHF